MHKLFPSQQPNEKIYLVVREHWILITIRLVIWAVFAIIPTFLVPFLQNQFPFITSQPYSDFVGLAVNAYYLLLLFTLFVLWLLYYLNVHIVSEERVVDIDQVGILSHVVSELNIDTIEDVTSETNGLLGNLFDFGTVYVQTAGTRERFEFENVPRPAEIANIILSLYEKQTPSPKEKI